MTSARLFGLHSSVKFKPSKLEKSRMRNEEKPEILCSCYSCIKWTPGAYESIQGIFRKHSGPIGLLTGSREFLASEWLDLLLLFAEQGNYLGKALHKDSLQMFLAQENEMVFSLSYAAPVLHNHISNPPFEIISNNAGTELLR